MDKVANGEAAYDYVEVMACDGGCVGGDGQACIVNEDESVEHALRVRAQDLKYIESRRAAKAADMSASATMLARAWSDLERRGDVYDEPIDWNALFESITQSILEQMSAEEVVEEAPAEEIVEEEIIEEIIEEVAVAEAEEAVEEEVVEEVIEEVAPIVEEEVVEEVAPIVEEEVIEEVAPIIEEEVEEIEEIFDEAEEDCDVCDDCEAEFTVDGKRNPYYRRLSGRERRKLKRKRKNS